MLFWGTQSWRHIFRETSEEIGKSEKSTLGWELILFFAWEKLLQREKKEKRKKIVERATSSGEVADIPDTKASSLVVTYEPVWAIGTGKAAHSRGCAGKYFLYSRISFHFVSAPRFQIIFVSFMEA